MKKARFLLFAALGMAFATTSCTQSEPPNPKFSTDHLYSLQFGMQESEVQEILGKPSIQNKSSFNIDHPKSPTNITVYHYNQNGTDVVLMFEAGQLSTAKLNGDSINLQVR